MSRLNVIDWAAMVLVIVGALNWGLVGLFGFNLVNALFGGVPTIESIVYVLVGIAGAWMIYTGVKLGTRGTREAREM
jgi:uncharacterized protein